jgi:hypothetical protein
MQPSEQPIKPACRPHLLNLRLNRFRPSSKYRPSVVQDHANDLLDGQPILRTDLHVPSIELIDCGVDQLVVDVWRGLQVGLAA